MIKQHKQQGMTLIEIMISLLIGVFLIGGVLQIFINTRQTYRMQENLSGMQENGRFAMDFLTKDIRTAGFLGCNIGATLQNILAANFLYDFGTAIEGFESTSATAWSPAINAAITTPLGGSDVITIRRAGADSFTVATHVLATDPLTLDAATTTVGDLKTAGFLKDDGTNNDAIAVVSNCTDATTFQVTGIAGGGLIFSHNASGDNTTNDLGATYPNSQIYTINTISYYIRTNPNNTPSLYKRVGGEDSVELIEGIEKMQILYGEDTDDDGTPNYYVSADQVVDMGKVVSVRISLLVRSIDDNLTTAPRDYTYNGVTTTPTDRRLRRVFTTTIALRNRLI